MPLNVQAYLFYFLQIFCHTATDVPKCPCLNGIRMVGDWWQMGDKTGK